MSRPKHVANVVVSQLNTVIVMAGSFVVTPAVLHGLGDSAYGGWLLINSFMGYLRFLDLGASAGTVKYGAGARERGDSADLARVMNTSAALFTVLGMLAMLGTIGLAGFLPHLYPSIAGDHAAVILTLGSALALELALRPFVASLRIRSIFFLYDSVEIGTYSVFKFGLVLYLAYYQGLSYRVLSLLALGETLARMLVVVGAALYLAPDTRRLNPFRAHRGMVGKLASMGAAVSIIKIADIVRFQLDAGVIGYFMPQSPESISIFGVGSRLVSIAFMVIGVIGGVLVPRFSGLSETGDKAGVMKLLRKVTLITGLANSLILVNLAVLGPQFLSLWLHKPWVATSGTILRVLLPGYYLVLLAGPGTGLLMARGQLRALTIFTVLEAIANLCLSALLVHPFGVIGVALGTSIPMAFFSALVFPMLLKKEIGLAPSEYLRMHAPAVAIGAVYFVLVGGLAFVPVPSYSRFFMLSTGSVIVFAALVLAFVPEARAEVLRRLSGRKRAPMSGG